MIIFKRHLTENEQKEIDILISISFPIQFSYQRYLSEYVLFKEDENIIGVGVILSINPFTKNNESFLCNFCVKKEYRNKGIGQKFLKEITDRYENISWVSCTSEIYKKWGYKNTGKVMLTNNLYLFKSKL